MGKIPRQNPTILESTNNNIPGFLDVYEPSNSTVDLVPWSWYYDWSCASPLSRITLDRQVRADELLTDELCPGTPG